MTGIEIAIAAAVIGAGTQMYGQMQEAKAVKKQNRLTRQRNNLEARRQQRIRTREALQQMRLAQARMGAQGAQGSVTNTVGTIGSGNTGNQVAINQGIEFGQQQEKISNNLSTASLISGVGVGISQLGQAGFNYHQATKPPSTAG